MMRRYGFQVRWVSMTSLLIVSILIFACGQDDPSAAEQVQRGQAIYARACANCHGREGEGMPMLGKSLRGNTFMGDRNDELLVEFLEEGRPSNHALNTTGVDMPPKGGDPSLSQQDLENLVAYLRTF